jgi:hypothetical protein
MMLRRFLYGVAFVSMLLTARQSRADWSVAGATGMGFHPNSSNDAPWISYTGYGVQNLDTSTGHTVDASLNASGGTGIGGNITFYVNGYNNGLNLSCSIHAIKSDSTVVSASGSTAANGTFEFPITIALPSNGNWFLSAACVLPRWTTGVPPRLYAVHFP